jgi:hypothetical protein
MKRLGATLAFALIFGVSLPGLARAATVRLAGGQTITLKNPDLSLTFSEVTRDQRCPPTLNCFWEGPYAVRLTVKVQGKAPIDVTLCNVCDEAKKDARVAGRTVALQALEPATDVLAALGRPARVTDYTVVLRLSGP